jgi:hypothetical protein
LNKTSEPGKEKHVGNLFHLNHEKSEEHELANEQNNKIDNTQFAIFHTKITKHPPDKLPPPEPPPNTNNSISHKSSTYVCDDIILRDYANKENHSNYPGYSYGEKINILVPRNKTTIATVCINMTTGTSLNITIRISQTSNDWISMKQKTIESETHGTEYVTTTPTITIQQLVPRYPGVTIGNPSNTLSDNNYANTTDTASDEKLTKRIVFPSTTHTATEATTSKAAPKV